MGTVSNVSRTQQIEGLSLENITLPPYAETVDPPLVLTLQRLCRSSPQCPNGFSRGRRVSGLETSSGISCLSGRCTFQCVPTLELTVWRLMNYFNIPVLDKLELQRALLLPLPFQTSSGLVLLRSTYILPTD